MKGSWLLASTTALVPLLLGCPSKDCTEVGCGQNTTIDFTFTQPGAYLFEVTVDDVKVTCRATLPLSVDFTPPCDRSGVILGVVGSELAPEQHSITGLVLQTTTAKTVAIRATRDGTLIGDKTIALTYSVTPGPNGPDCEPKECRSVRGTFP